MAEIETTEVEVHSERFTLIDKVRLDLPGLDLPSMSILAVLAVNSETGNETVIAAHARPEDFFGRGEEGYKMLHLESVDHGAVLPFARARILFPTIQQANYEAMSVPITMIDARKNK